jgi:hypothetical protein
MKKASARSLVGRPSEFRSGNANAPSVLERNVGFHVSGEIRTTQRGLSFEDLYSRLSDLYRDPEILPQDPRHPRYSGDNFGCERKL